MRPHLNRSDRLLRTVAALLPLVGLTAPAHADIYQWEYINPADPSQGKRQSTTLAPDGAGVSATLGADLSYRNLTNAYLTGADLPNATAYGANLTNADFNQANLSNVDFYLATLNGADFRDADIRGANFDRTPTQPCGIFGCGSYGTGIDVSQLYSTVSYQTGDLSGINFGFHNFIGINFAGQNLTNASFSRTSLVGADFTAADLRGAFFDCVSCISEAVFKDNIGNSGHIRGLDLAAGELLVVRDYDGNPSDYSGNPTPPIPITIDQCLTMGPGGLLRPVFEADAWDSIISFAPGIPVTLGGTLELTFADDVSIAEQIGRTFDLFNWTGVAPVGAFAVSSPYRWDLSNLYTTGEVTLTAVPEPTSLVPLILGVLLILAPRRARFPLAIIVLVVCISPAMAQLPMTGTYIPELQAVDALLQNVMADTPIPGGTIAITHDDKVIYERGIGYSNAARTVPMQETALMRLASVSKPITASAIQQLAKDGQLSLDDKVFNIAGNGGILNITAYNGTIGDSRLQDITVQHLLEHQGGWNRDTAGDLAFRDVQIANELGVPSPPGILNSARYILSQPLQFTPGADYNYSNIGYMFLGMVVEAASGQPYEDYVDEMVLGPAAIPAWEVDAGRTFAADQNPREPFYSTQITSSQNVYDPSGPRVPATYGGWDHERFLAFGGLIASSKAIALFAQNRIAGGPEVGKLWSDDTMHLEHDLGHVGSLEGSDTVVVQASANDWTYSILFDRRPADGDSYVISLYDPLKSILDGLSTWPAPLVYAGDFTNDQWLTLDDVTLFRQALELGTQAAFTLAFPTARYAAGDFDGNGLVNLYDSSQFVAALEHAGTPAEYIVLVPSLPGDFNVDGAVEGADFLAWQRGNSPNPLSPGDLSKWRSAYGPVDGAFMVQSFVPEPMCGASVLAIVLFQLRNARRKLSSSASGSRK